MSVTEQSQTLFRDGIAVIVVASNPGDLLPARLQFAQLESLDFYIPDGGSHSVVMASL